MTPDTGATVDHSCYITLFNYTSIPITITPGSNPSGTFDPPSIPQLAAEARGTPGQVFLTLGSGISGSSGELFLTGGSNNFQLSFGCPMSEDNFAFVKGTGQLVVTLYSSVEPIQWLTTGFSWPPPGVISTSGEPLFLLVAISSN